MSHDLPNKSYRRFESFREYEEVIDDMIARTERIIRVFDCGLASAWNTSQRDTLLREFLRRDPSNRLMIVVHDAGNVARSMARVVVLVRDFSHAVKIRQTSRVAQHVYDPFVVFDASHYVHKFHYRHMRAAQGTHDVEGALQLLDRYGELWEASAPAASADVSGL